MKKEPKFTSGRCHECKLEFKEAEDRFNQTMVMVNGWCPIWLHTKPCVAARAARLVAEERERKAKAEANAPYVSRFIPFETPHLSPHGEMVRITSLPQLRREENRFGAHSEVYANSSNKWDRR